MSEQKDLELLILGHAPLIQIETHEEKRALNLLTRIATRHMLPIFQWSVTTGLQRLDIDLGVQKHNAEPADVLAHIKAIDKENLYVLLDFDPYIKEPVNSRFVKEIAMQFEGTRNKLIFVSHEIDIPASLSHSTARFELSLPDENALRHLVREEANKWQTETGTRVTTDKKTLSRMVKNLSGLTFNDARRLIRNAVVDDGAITEIDLPEVMKTKYQLLNKDDVISYEYETAHFVEVGGMNKLKQWLQKREKFFHQRNSATTLDKPRGLLLLGVQGCGKSLAAKAIAGIWNVPLLRFDFGALYDKYIGESERNLRESLRTAEVMAPCVLWIDEIEKGISGGNDEGTSTRILGTLLTWLAENDAHVFVVATANNIEALPPELVRKGRLDEIFFVDLPSAQIREQIYSIHLEKRKLNADDFDLKAVATASKGFSGSEIEQVVVSVLYACDAQPDQITTEDLLREIKNTRPLSVVMAEQIDRLRDWASARTVPVD